MCNIDIRQAAKDAGIKLYEIAAEYGINDGNFSRRLRFELPDADKQRIFNIIHQLSKERGNKIAETQDI